MAYGKESHEITGEELLAAMAVSRAKLEAIDAEIAEPAEALFPEDRTADKPADDDVLG